MFRRRHATDAAGDRAEPDPSVIAAHWVPGWGRLTAAQRERLVEDAVAFADHLRWEPAKGFTVTREMELAITAPAALLTLELDDGIESYRGVSSVIVHPRAIVRTGSRPVGGGLYTDATEWLAGQAHHQGPVLIAWDSARRHARFPGAGENVLVHEFAHRLDMLDGVVDGTPLLDGADTLARWVTACTEAYDRLRAGEVIAPLRPYAATNAGEFFAVASEAFFTVPVPLRDAEPSLYEVLAAFYRQDPAAEG